MLGKLDICALDILYPLNLRQLHICDQIAHITSQHPKYQDRGTSLLALGGGGGGGGYRLNFEISLFRDTFYFNKL